VHGNLKNYQSFWFTLISIILGFTVMTGVLNYTHERFGHGHEEGEHHDEGAELILEENFH